MLYLTCTTITSIDLAHYGVSRAKDWVSVKCGTSVHDGQQQYIDMCHISDFSKSMKYQKNKNRQVSFFLVKYTVSFATYNCVLFCGSMFR